MVAVPKKAATVILLREKKPEGFEVFLLKRHEKSSFMGGNFVYPGGRVDRNDKSLDICSHCKGVSREEAAQILGGSISPEESLAYWVAGIRELFEEAGVFLAYDHAGTPLVLRNPCQQKEFQNYRDSLQKDKLTLCQLIEKEKLLLAVDQLHYYAHWITPEARSERFDTRFFLARHPEEQEAAHDQRETTLGVWLTPKQALEENLKGKAALSPPTLKTLEDLSRFKHIAEVFRALEKSKIHPILPLLTNINEETFIVFPWDPDYGIFQKGEIPKNVDHGRPSGPEDNTTRLILKKGCWIPYCYGKSGYSE
jgi:8-oxo-dGTP pyrophosphatase MutT (NUDIX family)